MKTAFCRMREWRESERRMIELTRIFRAAEWLGRPFKIGHTQINRDKGNLRRLSMLPTKPDRVQN